MILPIILIFVFCVSFLIPVYAESSDYSLSGNYHDYDIELFFSDGMIKGTITNNEKIINLDNSKFIERNSGFLIIDKENDLKILSKKVNDDKYIILVKIKPDTKLRFITTVDIINRNIGQRDLFNAMNEKLKQDEELNLSFKELELLQKNNLVESALEQYEADLENMIEYNNDGVFGDLTSEGILQAWEDSKIITGMGLVIQEEVIKSLVTVTDDIILHVLTDHYDKVNNVNQVFKFEVKTFDKNVYSGTDWNKFDGRLDGALINAKMKDSDGIIKQEFSGETQYGIYEGEQKLDPKLYPRGNYSLEIDVTFNEQKFSETLYFEIYEDYDTYNNPPIANAGIDQHLISGDIVTLDGSGSTDSDDHILYYTWEQISGTDVILLDDDTVNPTFTIPNIWDSFIFELMVNDGRKDSIESDIVEITSLHSDAGLNMTYVNGTSGFILNSTNIELDGFLSGDGIVEHITNYFWTVMDDLVPTSSTIQTSNLTDNTIVNPQFMPDQFGNYTFQLEFSDDKGLIDISNVTINVVDVTQ